MIKGEKMNKKYVLLTVLLISTLILAFPAILADPGELHVGAGYPYSEIQVAIDDAVSGDTIIVHEGTYEEDLLISKTLELKAAEGDEVTIKGVAAYDAFPLAVPNIEILADEVKIHGFTIESPWVPAGNYSSGMVINGTNVEIYENVFHSVGDGECIVIQTWSSKAMPTSNLSGLSIYDNVFRGNPGEFYAGVYINPDSAASGMASVYGNKFHGAVYYGIVTERNNTQIQDNRIFTRLTGTGYGIRVREYFEDPQEGVLVSGNIIKGSGKGRGFNVGIEVGKGVQELTDIEINDNMVKDSNVGIHVISDGVSVMGNKVMKTVDDGIQIAGNENQIGENRVNKCGSNGILVTGDDNEVYDNRVWKCGSNGILVTGDHNEVYDHRIWKNEGYGIKDDGIGNTVQGNHVKKNKLGDYSPP
jgi:hypothetical protein